MQSIWRMVNHLFRPICTKRSKSIDHLLNWTAFSKKTDYQIVSVVSLSLIRGPTAYLIGMQLIDCLTDAFMRWTLGSELTSIPIEDKMHEMVALGIGFLDKESCTRALKDDINLPVYISEPLVVLSLRSLLEKRIWTSRKNWMVRSFRTAVNRSSLGFVLEEALLLVLMENFWGESSRLADVFHCSEKLGSMKFTLVSLKRVAGNVMQSRPVSWDEGSSDRLGLKAQSPTDVLNFLEDPDGKAFLFPDTHMGGDLLCILQNPETGELILVAIQSKLTPDFIAEIWQKALNSVTPELFYTVVSYFVIPVSLYPYFDVYRS